MPRTVKGVFSASNHNPTHYRRPDPGVQGITYTVVCGMGQVHGRFFKHHTEPLYTLAVVRTPGRNMRGDIALHSDPVQAEKSLAFALAAVHNADTAELAGDPSLEGQPMYPYARIEPVTWHVGR